MRMRTNQDQDKNRNSWNVDAREIIKLQTQLAGNFLSKKARPNDWISSLIPIPKTGESVNPLKHQYYYSRWRATQTEYKQLFYKAYQTKSTMKWFKDTVGTEEPADNKLEQLRKSLVIFISKKKNSARIDLLWHFVD